MPEANEPNYDLSAGGAGKRFVAPELPYRPQDAKWYRPGIGLIGAGGITEHHLTAYRNAGYNVIAICDIDQVRAEDKAHRFFPEARVYTDAGDLLRRDDIEVVDIATHPTQRAPLVEQALRAHKHVLSQKPFVLDLDLGERLVELADQHGVKLAVNQNGRWSPHFSYIRHAIKQGLVGEVFSAHLAVHWDHSWVKKTPFNAVHHVVLYDFAIHWFDIVSQFLEGKTATRVFASNAYVPGQEATPPLLGQTLIEFDRAQASLVFDAGTPFGPQDRTYVAGTRGSIESQGPDLGKQTVTLYTAEGEASPKLEGSWFPDGFHGTMAALLCAIEEGREPENSARGNLKGLAVCFAACASADSGEPQIPGKVRRMPGS